MAIGYSVVHLARGMGEQGRIVTIDPSDEMISAATGYLQRAGLLDRVEIKRGEALEVMPNLDETFDLLFIDALKEEYSRYLDLGLPRLRTGGVVIVDNLLWGGRVAGGAIGTATGAATGWAGTGWFGSAGCAGTCGQIAPLVLGDRIG